MGGEKGGHGGLASSRACCFQFRRRPWCVTEREGQVERLHNWHVGQEEERRGIAAHAAKSAGWRRGETGAKTRPPERGKVKTRTLKTAHSAALRASRVRHPVEGTATLSGAGAGWARSLMPPAHGLGAGRNASGDFFPRGLFTGLIAGFFAMEQGFLALFRLALCRVVRLGSGGVLVVTMPRPVMARGSGNRTKSAESEREANNQKESLHCEHLN